MKGVDNKGETDWVGERVSNQVGERVGERVNMQASQWWFGRVP